MHQNITEVSRMYLCICKGITLDMAKKAALKFRSSKDLAEKLGVGSDCGTCLIDALDNLEKTLISKKPAEKYCQISEKAS